VIGRFDVVDGSTYVPAIQFSAANQSKAKQIVLVDTVVLSSRPTSEGQSSFAAWYFGGARRNREDLVMEMDRILFLRYR
jgi:hypothetical protein